MLKHIWSVLCRKCVIDSDTNNVSLTEVMERIVINFQVKRQQAKALTPVNLPIDFEIVSLWFKDTNRNDADIKAILNIAFINPQKKILKETSQVIEISSGMKRVRTRVKIQGIQLQESGDYFFRLSIKEAPSKNFKVIAELPLEICLNKELI